MQEYLITIPLNISGSEAFVALFFCLNIPTVDSIVTRVRSYGGVQEVELFIITRLAYHQEWLVREINNGILVDVVAFYILTYLSVLQSFYKP